MKRTLTTTSSKGGPEVSERLHRRRGLSPAWLVGTLLLGSVVIAGCSEAEQTPGTDNPANEGAEATMDPENGSPSGESTSRAGLIDIDGGYTQDEQLAELEIVVEIMREHFGEDVATIDGEPWTAERHDAQVAAMPQGGGVYRHGIEFNIPPGNLEETYALADEIAKELGLTENVNNSNGIGPNGRIYYGAGREDGRIFLVTADSSELAGATYQTRHSDDESIIGNYERIIDDFRQENRQKYSPDTPIDPEELEMDDGESG